MPIQEYLAQYDELVRILRIEHIDAVRDLDRIRYLPQTDTYVNGVFQYALHDLRMPKHTLVFFRLYFVRRVEISGRRKNTGARRNLLCQGVKEVPTAPQSRAS